MYKRAFQCKKCPQSSGENGCPCWIELIWRNDETNDVKTENGCYFQLTPKLLLEAVKAANVSSENSSVARNSFEQGVIKLQDHLYNAIEAVKEIPENSEE